MQAVGIRALLGGAALVGVSTLVFFAASKGHGRDKIGGGAPAPLTAVSDGGRMTVAIERGSETLVCVDNTGKAKAVEVKLEVSDPRHLALTPDGKVAAVGGIWGKIAVVRIAPKPSVRATCDGKGQLGAVAISPDGKTVAAGGAKEGKVILFDATSGEEIRTLKHDDRISGLCFSPDGKTLAVGTEDGTCRLWSVEVGESVWEAKLHKGALGCVAFFPCGKRIVTGSDDGTICVVDAKAGKTLTSYLAHRRTVFTVAVSLDGKYVGSCGLENAVNVWDAENHKAFASEKINDGFAGLAFGKDHLFVAEGTRLRTLDLKTKKLSDLRK